MNFFFYEKYVFSIKIMTEFYLIVGLILITYISAYIISYKYKLYSYIIFKLNFVKA